MTRIPEGITFSVAEETAHGMMCNIMVKNTISKTALGRTYRSYLKREALRYAWCNQTISDEQYHDAWCDNRSYRYKKILSRSIKRFINKLKSYKIIIKK